MLNEQDLRVLSNKLHVPLIISDIHNGPGKLTDDIQLSLHEAISDMQPDSALLSIALCAKILTHCYIKKAPTVQILAMECDRIADEYGSLWLSNACHLVVDPDEIYDTLVHTADDLEDLADLLEHFRSILIHKDPQAAQICEILYVQAKSHALIAETFMQTADMALGVEPEEESLKAPLISMIDNVIPFPGTQSA